MKNKLIFTVILGALLAGCASKPSESITPSESEAPSSEISIPTIIDDSEPLPSIPDGGVGDIGSAEFGTIVIDGKLPDGWRYLSGDERTPGVTFYADGGLKFNFRESVLTSGVFSKAITSLKIEGKLNSNQQTVAATTLEVYKVDAGTETLADSKVFSEKGLTTYSFVVNVPANMKQFAIKMPVNGGYNVNIKTITIG